MSHCPRCTSEVPEASRFCGQCGSDVTPTEAATQTSVGESGTGPGGHRVSTPSQFSPTATGIGLLTAVALYGYYISSLAGRTVFADNLLEQT